MVDPRIAQIWRYHERSKHSRQKLAASKGFLDWTNQPSPFRRYQSAALIPLDEPPIQATSPGIEQLYRPREGITQLNRARISQLLYDALSISAWKTLHDASWSLRVNPSSGNLHPTECYLIAPSIAGLSKRAALYHYTPQAHALEELATLPRRPAEDLRDALPDDSFLLGLTYVAWREVWKYGERSFRYINLDAGHALTALTYSASLLGWRLTPLRAVSDQEASHLFGVASQFGPELERVSGIWAVSPGHLPTPPLKWTPPRSLRLLKEHPHQVNQLSPSHHHWPIVDEVAEQCRRPALKSLPKRQAPEHTPTRLPPPPSLPARYLIRSRRSAVEMDERSSLDAQQLYRILSALLPCEDHTLWNQFNTPRVHLVFFAHKVRGLEQGLYFLPRSARGQQLAKERFQEDARWEKPKSCPDSLPLSLLTTFSTRSIARMLACGQAIAGNSVATFALLAELEGALAKEGPWAYREVHWEAGAIGQTLYLEAEAAGLSGTGLGCFFDNDLHKLLGLKGRALQTIYAFALGQSIDDPRIRQTPPYPKKPSA